MGDLLSQNFIEYCMLMDRKNCTEGEAGVDSNKFEEKKPNFEVYSRLKKRNGK